MYLRFLDVIIKLNNRGCVRLNNSNSKISPTDLTDSKIEQLEQHYLFLCVEGACHALVTHSVTALSKRPELVPTASYTYLTDGFDGASRDGLQGSLVGIGTRSLNPHQLLETKVRTNVDSEQT